MRAKKKKQGRKLPSTCRCVNLYEPGAVQVHTMQAGVLSMYVMREEVRRLGGRKEKGWGLNRGRDAR